MSIILIIRKAFENQGKERARFAAMRQTKWGKRALPACMLCACTLLPGMRAYALCCCRGVRGLQHPPRPFTAATQLLSGERAGSGGEMVGCLGCLCGAGKTVTYWGRSSYCFQRGTAEESQSRGGMRSQATTSR